MRRPPPSSARTSTCAPRSSARARRTHLQGGSRRARALRHEQEPSVSGSGVGERCQQLTRSPRGPRTRCPIRPAHSRPSAPQPAGTVRGARGPGRRIACSIALSSRRGSRRVRRPACSVLAKAPARPHGRRRGGASIAGAAGARASGCSEDLGHALSDSSRMASNSRSAAIASRAPTLCCSGRAISVSANASRDGERLALVGLERGSADGGGRGVPGVERLEPRQAEIVEARRSS